jgi:hypothetical protein
LLENLTPWKKLLPCVTGGSNHKGLAGLLDNAPKLHHSAYHSLRMDLRKICAVSIRSISERNKTSALFFFNEEY